MAPYPVDEPPQNKPLPSVEAQDSSLSMVPYLLLAAARPSDRSVDEVVLDALSAIRQHLDMEVAFVSEFLNSRRYFRYIDAAQSTLADVPLEVGQSDPLEESFCQRVVDGRLPELIRDANALPAALDLAVTTDLPVGAHLSVPIRLSDGQLYGTFCCFSRRPNPSLGDRDLTLMHLFAEFTARQIGRDLDTQRDRQEMTQRVSAVLDPDAFTIVYQPIVRLCDQQTIGFEALTRFWAKPLRSPDVWFNEAAAVGLSEPLEMAAIAKALAGLPNLPEPLYLSINVSPEHILNGAVQRALAEAPLHRLMLEVTEHVAIPDYAQFDACLAPLRDRGMRLAVDDAGAGYASFLHILQLKPDVIKLDIGLIRHIDTDLTRRALTAALVGFAQETGSAIVAEGVETTGELHILQQLQVNTVQGYLFGHPLPLEDAW